MATLCTASLRATLPSTCTQVTLTPDFYSADGKALYEDFGLGVFDEASGGLSYVTVYLTKPALILRCLKICGFYFFIVSWPTAFGE